LRPRFDFLKAAISRFACANLARRSAGENGGRGARECLFLRPIATLASRRARSGAVRASSGAWPSRGGAP
jgi:hypothetical protein